MKQKELTTEMFDRAQAWRECGDDRYIFLNCYALMTQNMLRADDRQGAG